MNMTWIVNLHPQSKCYWRSYGTQLYTHSHHVSFSNCRTLIVQNWGSFSRRYFKIAMSITWGELYSLRLGINCYSVIYLRAYTFSVESNNAWYLMFPISKKSFYIQKSAEAHLPVLTIKEGIPLNVYDASGHHMWTFKYRFGFSNSL